MVPSYENDENNDHLVGIVLYSISAGTIVTIIIVNYVIFIIIIVII